MIRSPYINVMIMLERKMSYSTNFDLIGYTEGQTSADAIIAANGGASLEWRSTTLMCLVDPLTGTAYPLTGGASILKHQASSTASSNDSDSTTTV